MWTRHYITNDQGLEPPTCIKKWKTLDTKKNCSNHFHILVTFSLQVEMNICQLQKSVKVYRSGDSVFFRGIFTFILADYSWQNTCWNSCRCQVLSNQISLMNPIWFFLYYSFWTFNILKDLLSRSGTLYVCLQVSLRTKERDKYCESNLHSFIMLKNAASFWTFKVVNRSWLQT